MILTTALTQILSSYITFDFECFTCFRIGWSTEQKALHVAIHVINLVWTTCSAILLPLKHTHTHTLLFIYAKKDRSRTLSEQSFVCRHCRNLKFSCSQHEAVSTPAHLCSSHIILPAGRPFWVLITAANCNSSMEMQPQQRHSFLTFPLNSKWGGKERKKERKVTLMIYLEIVRAVTNTITNILKAIPTNSWEIAQWKIVATKMADHIYLKKTVTLTLRRSGCAPEVPWVTCYKRRRAIAGTWMKWMKYYLTVENYTAENYRC